MENDLISRKSIMDKLYAKANEWRGSYTGDAYATAARMVKKEPAVDPCATCKYKPVKKEKPSVDLEGKCGSCEFSVLAENVFGKAKCYVRCTNEEHLTSRSYYNRPLVAVRQRTAKACKKYKRRADNGT